MHMYNMRISQLIGPWNRCDWPEEWAYSDMYTIFDLNEMDDLYGVSKFSKDDAEHGTITDDSDLVEMSGSHVELQMVDHAKKYGHIQMYSLHTYRCSV